VTYPQLRSEDPELATESRNGLPSLVLAALGVVYGDIGTSPLYAFREALHATAGLGSHRENVLGILSLIVWALTIVVTVKYVMFVLRADNRGEGGTLSLMTLARQSFTDKPAWILVLGVAGASSSLATPLLPQQSRFCPPSKESRWSRPACRHGSFRSPLRSLPYCFSFNVLGQVVSRQYSDPSWRYGFWFLE